MRLTIAAGLIMGVSLAIQSGIGAQAKAKVAAASARRVHAVAPWYIAENDGRGAERVAALTQGDRAGRLRG
jgi:hypothetical protein